MNAEQKRQLRAEFASGRRHTDNDNAKPDYRRITLRAEEVERLDKAWRAAIDAGASILTIDCLATEYRNALIGYFETSEMYWGRR